MTHIYDDQEFMNGVGPFSNMLRNYRDLAAGSSTPGTAPPAPVPLAPGIDYTNNPPGVHPDYQNYLTSTGVVMVNTAHGTDPLSSAIPAKFFGGKSNMYELFWKMVFPVGDNDCDLLAAINNINDKINQYQGLVDYSPGGLKGWVHKYILTGGGCPGCQGDAFAVVSGSLPVFKKMSGQYQAIYDNHVVRGGGCSNDGILVGHVPPAPPPAPVPQGILLSQPNSVNVGVGTEKYCGPLSDPPIGGNTPPPAKTCTSTLPVDNKVPTPAANGMAITPMKFFIGLAVLGVLVTGAALILRHKNESAGK